MTTGISIPIVGSADVFAGSAERAIGLLERIATNTENAGKKADEAKASNDRLAEGLDRVASRARDGIEVFQIWAGRVASLVNGVAELATEQQRLDRASERLHLNFAQAADGASGYVDVLQVMQGATNAASRDLRLTQRELDAFTRVAAQTARDRGQEFSQVFEQLVESANEGGEEFAKFGTTMGAVSETSHTVQERLDAVVRRAGELSTTADTASDRIARLRGELRDAGRTASESFINELLRLETVAPAIDGTTTRTRDLREELRAAGQAAAFVVSGITNGLGVIVGAVGVGVRGIVSFAHITGTAIANATRGPAAVAAAVRAAATEEADAIEEIMRFTRDRAGSLAALAADRGPEASAATAAPSADMVFTLDEVEGADRNRRQRAHREAGSSGRRTQRATLAQLMERAISNGNNDLTGRRNVGNDQLAVLGEQEELANTLAKAEAQRRVDEAAFGQSDDVRMRDRRETDRVERERVELDNRYQQQRSFTENLEELYRRQGSAAQSLAEVTQSAFSELTSTLGAEADAVLRGQKSFGEGLESGGKKMLDFLAKTAWAKAAFFGAEALGNFLLGSPVRAGVAGKTAAGYLGAGIALSAVAGAAGGGAPPEPASRTPSAPSERMPAGDRAGAAAAPQVVHNYYAPRIGGRDAAAWEVGEQLRGYGDEAETRTRRDRA